MRFLYMAGGLLCVGLGVIGMFLPVMPTVVFFLLAALLFARSNPEWERRIMEHETLGPPIRAFRERGVIRPWAKASAVGAMAVSSVGAIILLDGPWSYAPAAVCALCALFILTRPSR